MAHIVHCRICKREIDIDSSHDWIMPSKHWYYHPDCYRDWIQRKSERNLMIERNEEDWFNLLKDYIYRDIKMPDVDWSKVSSQWKNFLKTKHFTPKGIYFAILYFYEVQHGNVEMSKGGIGIVSNIYKESAEYWTNLELRRRGTLDNIVKQMATRANRASLIIQEAKNPKSARIKYDLKDFEVSDNDG